MDAIEEIKARLQEYPLARYEATSSSISVYPITSDGFTVTMVVGSDEYTVSFDGWHEAFRDKGEAIDCFAFGLSKECRLKEFRRGDFAYKWTVEGFEGGNWVEDSTTGLLLFPFWKKKGVRYLQNQIILS